MIYITMPSGYPSERFYYPVEAERNNFDFGPDSGSPVLASVAISGEMIYVADDGGNLYAFKEVTDN